MKRLILLFVMMLPSLSFAATMDLALGEIYHNKVYPDSFAPVACLPKMTDDKLRQGLLARNWGHGVTTLFEGDVHMIPDENILVRCGTQRLEQTQVTLFFECSEGGAFGKLFRFRMTFPPTALTEKGPSAKATQDLKTYCERKNMKFLYIKFVDVNVLSQ
ncbi:hypothetical protein [Bdellovibrio bacteriovorus]|uniref:hypothetical protein n=1 Tax=Bdellovibrio bacteriovorus TaxID=959 RepID=UPI0035A5A1AF